MRTYLIGGNVSKAIQTVYIKKIKCIHAVKYYTARKRSASLTYTKPVQTWKPWCSVRETDTQGPTACDSIDRKRPEQEDPETGSGLVGARG
jgi:hypothetical protein